MPLAMGCSERASTAAASLRTSSSPIELSKTRMSVTPNLPSVSVPVLSKMTAWIFLARSNATRFLMRRPFLAEIAVETGDDQRHRQAERVRAGDDHHRDHPFEGEGEPLAGKASQRNRVSAPAPMATTVSQSAARSERSLGPRLALLGLSDEFDDLGQVGIAAGLPDLDGDRALAVDGAADNPSPALLATGSDSPVSMASLTAVSPSTTSPSAGTFSPGLTRTRSPGSSSSRGTSITAPSARSGGPPRASAGPAPRRPVTPP